MPIYDYVCGSCRHRLEVIHGINDTGPRFCPSCGAEGTMRKALTSPAIHFKGSGWAKKDRSSTSASRSKSEAGSSTGDGSAAGKSEASSGDGATSKGKTDADPGPAKEASKHSSDPASSSTD